MKPSPLLALVAGVLFAGSAAAQDWSTIRIATEGAYAPWNFTNAAGQLDGFDVDLANELCARMGAQCEIVAQAWDGIIPALQAGRYDAIMAGMSITDARMEVIDFTRSYATTPAIFVAPKDSDFAAAGLPETRVDMTEISAEEQALLDQVKGLLDGLTVGVQTATIHENFLREHMGDIDIRTYDSQENLDLDLQAGRIDVALADQSGWQPLLEGELGEDFTRVGPGFARGIFGRGVGVGIRKEDAALKDKFNAAIQSALDDGTVSELAIKWFGFDSATTD
ncbi:MAG: transporter substrate-binding domain-containing protein [Geminicoccaceae bacterium]|nr:transporter substrate-binding domain-containing protein [Geminicoccaceae bacterium]HRY26402.1 lysine/arginine/ornithine ABC transporter substrate-binding protein [Geminicoccaceae bacterium]